MLKKGLHSAIVLTFVSMLFILSGCSLFSKPTTSSQTSNTSNNNSDLVITENKDLITMDIAAEYIIDAESLATYKNNQDPLISYVNIEEFLTFMEGGLVDLDITIEDNVKIAYSFDVPVEYQEYYDGSTYTYEMTINADTDIISFTDFDMLSNINGPMLTEYETDLVVSDIEIVDPDPSLEINLKDYGFDIVLYEGKYYLPLYLANIFFTGSMINVYEMNDFIYVFDDFSDITPLENSYTRNDNITSAEISIHTEKYLALFFDYFYGLKDYKNVNTYRDIFEDDYNINSVTTFNNLHKEIERFIYNLNDLHTNLVSAGYMNKNYSPLIARNQKLNDYIDAYMNNSCALRKDEISYTAYGTTFVIQVNQFTLETREKLVPAMEAAENYTDIIIDVSCNPGGNLIGVIELVSYMSNEEIQVSYINPRTNGKFTEYYEPSGNVLSGKNFYVYASAASYSAANLFTSIVKDQELAVVFGEKTGGGACAITMTVLPDGSIIVISSNMVLVNKNGEVIEDGIEVDVEKQGPISWSNIISELNQ